MTVGVVFYTVRCVYRERERERERERRRREREREIFLLLYRIIVLMCGEVKEPKIEMAVKK